MGRWGYVFIDLEKDFKVSNQNKLLSKLDKLSEVDSIDLVDGEHDLVATVQVPVSFNEVVNSIKKFEGIQNISVCKIVGNRKEW